MIIDTTMIGNTKIIIHDDCIETDPAKIAAILERISRIISSGHAATIDA